VGSLGETVKNKVSEKAEVPQAETARTITLAVPVKVLFQSKSTVEVVSENTPAPAGSTVQRYLPNPALVEIEVFGPLMQSVCDTEVGILGVVVPGDNIKIKVSEADEVPQTDVALTTTLAVPVKALFQLMVRLALVSPACNV